MCHIVQRHIDEGGTYGWCEFEAVAGKAKGIDKAGKSQLEIMNEAVFGGLAFMDEAVEQGEDILVSPTKVGQAPMAGSVGTTIEVRS